MKKILQIYGEGWWLIIRCAAFAIALWVILLPLKIIEAFSSDLSNVANLIIACLFFGVYFPFAIYMAYHLMKDLNKTEHRFVPLIERLRKRVSPRPD